MSTTVMSTIAMTIIMSTAAVTVITITAMSIILMSIILMSIILMSIKAALSLARNAAIIEIPHRFSNHMPFAPKNAGGCLILSCFLLVAYWL